MAETVLQGAGIAKAFGAHQVLSDVRFGVAEGEIVGLLGPNGSGKSTLLNIVSGFSRADAGEIRFRGEELAGLAAHDIARRGLVRTFQLPSMPHRMSVREVLSAGSREGAGLVEAFLRRRADDPEVETLIDQFALRRQEVNKRQLVQTLLNGAVTITRGCVVEGFGGLDDGLPFPVGNGQGGIIVENARHGGAGDADCRGDFFDRDHGAHAISGPTIRSICLLGSPQAETPTSSRSSQSMAPGRPSRKPCASVQPSLRRTSSCSWVSTPSASTGTERLWPRARMARTMALDCSLLSTSLMKERSSLILSKGKLRSVSSEE